MPKAIQITDSKIYMWGHLAVKRDLLGRNGGGKVAFVEAGNGTVHLISGQENLEPLPEIPLDAGLEDSDSINESTDPSEGFADFLEPPVKED